MAHTVTGNFPIGFRRNWSDWQKDLAATIRFGKEAGYEFIDVTALPADELQSILSAGFKIGSVDLKQSWTDLVSPDAGKRKAAVAEAAAHIASAAALGVRNIFAVIIPEDPTLSRNDNMGFAVDGFGQLCGQIAPTGARLAIEGWPGRAPYYSSLACTPEGYRLLFKEIASDAIGINFDPSHLIRMGIDYIRFVSEFADRVYHVHGKDTELLDEGLYEFGNLQPATRAKPHGYGAHHWRYTIPGHGVTRWGMLLGILKTAGYDGGVSVELEDEQFMGSEQAEKQGLIASREFLTSV
jgi:sugar phosphate isomerase/epimerase